MRTYYVVARKMPQDSMVIGDGAETLLTLSRGDTPRLFSTREDAQAHFDRFFNPKGLTMGDMRATIREATPDEIKRGFLGS